MIKKEKPNTKSPNFNRLVGMVGATTLLLTVSSSDPDLLWNEFSRSHITNSVSNRLHHIMYSSPNNNLDNHPKPNDKKSLFYSISIPAMSLRKYIQRFVSYSKAVPVHFAHAILLIGRIGVFEPCLNACLHNIHRLFTVAIAIAMEMTNGNESLDMENIRKVGGISSSSELKVLIQAFKHYVKHKVEVSRSELEQEFSKLAPLRFYNSDGQTVSFISSMTTPQIDTGKETTGTPSIDNCPVEIDISDNPLQRTADTTRTVIVSHETTTLEVAERHRVNNCPIYFNSPNKGQRYARDDYTQLEHPIQKQKSKKGFRRGRNLREICNLSNLLSVDISESVNCAEKST